MRPWVISVCLLLAGCTPFNADRWREADLSTRARADMVDGLLREHTLRGMSRSAVVALLGQPTPTDKWRDSELVYVLGPEGGFISIDSEWLLIELDATGKVVSHAVVTD